MILELHRLNIRVIMYNMVPIYWRAADEGFSAREAKHQFGRLIDTARAEPVVIEKHGRPVVVVVSVEEYERLTVQRTSLLGMSRPEGER